MKVEEVFVIPDYPHAWWRRPDVKVGRLVRLANYFGRKGDYGVYRVRDVWDEGVELEQVSNQEGRPE